MLLTRIVAGVVSILVGGAALLVGQAPGGAGRITVDVKSPGTPVPPRLYGIFYEEINHTGDGGLYAELVRNRGFEDANFPRHARVRATSSFPRARRTSILASRTIGARAGTLMNRIRHGPLQ
jgi:hypothetical protein